MSISRSDWEKTFNQIRARLAHTVPPVRYPVVGPSVIGVKAGLSLVALSPEPVGATVKYGQECYNSSGTKITGTLSGFTKTTYPADEDGWMTEGNAIWDSDIVGDTFDENDATNVTKGSKDMKVTFDATVNWHILTVDWAGTLDLSAYFGGGVNLKFFLIDVCTDVPGIQRLMYFRFVTSAGNYRQYYYQVSYHPKATMQTYAFGLGTENEDVGTFNPASVDYMVIGIIDTASKIWYFDHAYLMSLTAFP